MRSSRRVALGLALLLALALSLALAQTRYELRWFAVGGGGRNTTCWIGRP